MKKKLKAAELTNISSVSTIWDKTFRSGLSKFFKGCLPQNLLSPLLNTLSHIFNKRSLLTCWETITSLTNFRLWVYLLKKLKRPARYMPEIVRGIILQNIIIDLQKQIFFGVLHKSYFEKLMYKLFL